MNVKSKICGIGRDVIGFGFGATSAATHVATAAPGTVNSNSLHGRIATALGVVPGSLRPPTPYYGTGPSMAPMTPPPPAALASNPYNLPGLPGYNPALAQPYNAANPYNVPGLPGYNPYQPTNPASGYNAANPYNMPGLPGYNAYAPSTQQPYSAPSYYGGGDYYAPTAADFGLPSSYDPTGGSGMSPDLSYAFSDPTDLSAMASYYDPMSQIGPWSGY